MLQKFQTTIRSFALLLPLSAVFAIAADAPKALTKSDEVKKTESEETKLIKAEEAKDHIDKTVTVEFTVVAAKELVDKNICFLNSEKNVKSPTNFTAFIKNTKKFKEASKLEKPAVHYFKKKVQVTGKVVKFQEKLEIVIESPDQIKIVEEKEEKEAGKKSDTTATK
jgi:DNA/RNA endonuclease YhcR with UshA esterase domain